jgi:hypothetical protein
MLPIAGRADVSFTASGGVQIDIHATRSMARMDLTEARPIGIDLLLMDGLVDEDFRLR